MTLLPNTAGCYTADDAVRAARLGREVGLSNWVKLEVLGDEQTLWPDNEALLAATKTLVKEGFVVFPYTSDDPIVCRKLEDAGAAAVMPLGAPIGSGLGIQNPNNISIILERAKVPVIVDAGVGTASDACVAMELGAAGVLMNTGIAGADGPGPDGPRDARRRAGGPGRVPGRADPEEALRHRVLAGRRASSARNSAFRKATCGIGAAGAALAAARGRGPAPPLRPLSGAADRTAPCNPYNPHATFRQLLRKPRTIPIATFMFFLPPSVRLCGETCVRSKGGRS